MADCFQSLLANFRTPNLVCESKSFVNRVPDQSPGYNHFLSCQSMLMKAAIYARGNRINNPEHKVYIRRVTSAS